MQLEDMTGPGRYDNVCRGIIVQDYITGPIGRLCCCWKISYSMHGGYCSTSINLKDCMESIVSLE